MGSTKARLDERGRLQLPAPLRRRLGLRPGDEVMISDEVDGARLTSTQSAARSLIGLAGRLDHSAVDDLHDLRRQDVANEDGQANPPL